MKSTSLLLFIILFIKSISTSFAAFQCGSYLLSVDERGYAFINKEETTSQKIIFLKDYGDYANMAMDMGLMPASDGNNYGFEFVKRNGKAFLNVQLLQANMDIPPIIGSFPCKKVPD
ncbi:hypothetical protein EV102420_05_00020 [Pseudescherichia vulneris NBRC 102420]|uniref:C-type lysozyme inhibitor domain-containing protein n=1 Tax=Pseudescherichia vulneris NBRC 102420 TaxID=1115515 RepID=A0A090UZ02_PSEVU|nr:hypothetical protein [Pseudescherichia vulneris]GAL57068.1 hypothetical protein EV102420_05_00020 [Pseudescherichia vulneris NBRC 102420]